MSSNYEHFLRIYMKGLREESESMELITISIGPATAIINEVMAEVLTEHRDEILRKVSARRCALREQAVRNE